MKENGFKLAKARSRLYPALIITDADYVDDIALLENTPTQAESLLHSLERAAAGTSLHVNAHKTDYICFNLRSDISTLNASSLKLMDKFTYLGNNVSSTKRDINTSLAKAWTTIDKLPVMWKSNLADKLRRIFPSSGRVDTTIWMQYMGRN